MPLTLNRTLISSLLTHLAAQNDVLDNANLSNRSNTSTLIPFTEQHCDLDEHSSDKNEKLTGQLSALAVQI